MNAFAVATPGIPIVAGGDFNIPLTNNTSTQEAFEILLQIWEHKEVQPNVGSWHGGSVLDAVFTTNDPSERLEGLREAIAEMRAALERLEAELARLEAANN